MPFTPFHFGPAATVAFALKRHIDWPIFILVNVVIDIEPLSVIIFGLDYPLHGYCHAFLFATMIGLLSAVAGYLSKNVIKRIMNFLRLNYQPGFKKMIIAGVLGAWFHVFIDSFMYPDIRPFYPLGSNPLYAAISFQAIYVICALFFIPAIALYIYNRNKGTCRFPR